jgi:hypothetical protein
VKRSLPAIFIFSLCFFSLFSFAFAQELNFDRAYGDYVYNYNLYRESYNTYLTARETFLKYKTLTSKNEALGKTKEMLQKQDEVIKTYLTALRVKLTENPGLSSDEQNILFSNLDNEVQWFRQHQEEINLANTLEEIISLSEKSKEQYQKTEVLIYETLGAIFTSKEISLREEISQKIKSLKEKIGEIRLKGDKNTSLAEHWLLEAENRLTQSQEKQFEAQQNLSKIKSSLSKTRVYNEAQSSLEESHQLLKEANSYLKEIIRELKYAD